MYIRKVFHGIQDTAKKHYCQKLQFSAIFANEKNYYAFEKKGTQTANDFENVIMYEKWIGLIDEQY